MFFFLVVITIFEKLHFACLVDNSHFILKDSIPPVLEGIGDFSADLL